MQATTIKALEQEVASAVENREAAQAAKAQADAKEQTDTLQTK